MYKADEDRLCTLLHDLLQLDTMKGVEDLNQKTCPKWDSLAQMSLISILENEFSISIGIEDFDELTSYASIKKMLIKKGI